MRQLRAVYRSQARLFARDRVTVIITVLLPLLLSVFFGYIFGPSQSSGLRVAVVNSDSGRVGGDLVRALGEAGMTVTNTDLPAATDLLSDGDVQLVLLVPARLSQDVDRKTRTSVTAMVNSGQNPSSDVAILAARALVDGLDRKVSATSALVGLKTQDLATMKPTLAAFYVPNFLAVSMLWLSIFATALPLVKEREDGTLTRISITPLSKMTFMAGVTLWRMTVGVVQSALFIAVAFMIDVGDVVQWPLLVAAVLLGNLVFTVMGYLIAGISRSLSSAEGIAQVVNFGFLFLSGVFFTADMLPEVVTKISYGIPLTYLADLLRQSMTGYPAMFPAGLGLAVLGGVGALFAGLALRTWRWK